MFITVMLVKPGLSAMGILGTSSELPFPEESTTSGKEGILGVVTPKFSEEESLIYELLLV